MTPKALLAWGFIGVTLAIFADIPPTSDVAVAFAYLILLAVLFHSGVKVFTGLSSNTDLGVGAGATGSQNFSPNTNVGVAGSLP